MFEMLRVTNAGHRRTPLMLVPRDAKSNRNTRGRLLRKKGRAVAGDEPQARLAMALRGYSPATSRRRNTTYAAASGIPI
jgi:hypothetical protein